MSSYLFYILGLVVTLVACLRVLSRRRSVWVSGLRALLKIFILISVLAGVVVWDIYPVTLRYRLTVAVENGNTESVGSGVIEVNYNKEMSLLPLPSHSEWHYETRGQAVVVDLGVRGPLFVLLKAGEDSRSDPPYIALKAFGFLDGPRAPISYPVRQRLGWIASLAGRTGEKKEISPNDAPMFVRFKDIKDPKTVERVDPANMAATLGAGVRLKSVTIEITDDSVTKGIEKYLPWLRKVKGYLDGQFTGGGPELSNILDTTSFWKGTNQ